MKTIPTNKIKKLKVLGRCGSKSTMTVFCQRPSNMTLLGGISRCEKFNKKELMGQVFRYPVFDLRANTFINIHS